jgi:hypothetical protein
MSSSKSALTDLDDAGPESIILIVIGFRVRSLHQKREALARGMTAQDAKSRLRAALSFENHLGVQKSEAMPLFSQSPYRVGSRPFGP